MLWIIIIVFQLVTQPTYTETNLASRFAYEGDIWLGGKSPCLRRVVKPTDNIIAHRTLPCRTRVRLTNPRTKKTTISYVGERGPYGACTYPGWKKNKKCPKGYWVVKKTAKDPGIWRGGFDLTPKVSRALGHNGMEYIKLEVVPRKKRVPRSKRPSA